MENQTRLESERPDANRESSNAAPKKERTVDEIIREMEEKSRLAQIETNKRVDEITKRLRTRTI